MSGRPAEVWYRFRFKTVPDSVSVVVALTSLIHLVGPIVEEVTMRRADGYLPLTRASVRRLRVVRWGFVSLIPFAVLCWFAAASIAQGTPASSDRSAAGDLLLLLGIVSMLLAAFGIPTVWRNYGPKGRVFGSQAGQTESLIELSNVHPAFVKAVAEARRDSVISASTSAGREFEVN